MEAWEIIEFWNKAIISTDWVLSIFQPFVGMAKECFMIIIII